MNWVNIQRKRRRKSVCLGSRVEVVEGRELLSATGAYSTANTNEGTADSGSYSGSDSGSYSGSDSGSYSGSGSDSGSDQSGPAIGSVGIMFLSETNWSVGLQVATGADGTAHFATDVPFEVLWDLDTSTNSASGSYYLNVEVNGELIDSRPINHGSGAYSYGGEFVLAQADTGDGSSEQDSEPGSMRMDATVYIVGPDGTLAQADASDESQSVQFDFSQVLQSVDADFREALENDAANGLNSLIDGQLQSLIETYATEQVANDPTLIKQDILDTLTPHIPQARNDLVSVLLDQTATTIDALSSTSPGKWVAHAASRNQAAPTAQSFFGSVLGYVSNGIIHDQFLQGVLDSQTIDDIINGVTPITDFLDVLDSYVDLEVNWGNPVDLLSPTAATDLWTFANTGGSFPSLLNPNWKDTVLIESVVVEYPWTKDLPSILDPNGSSHADGKIGVGFSNISMNGIGGVIATGTLSTHNPVDLGAYELSTGINSSVTFPLDDDEPSGSIFLQITINESSN